MKSPGPLLLTYISPCLRGGLSLRDSQVSPMASTSTCSSLANALNQWSFWICLWVQSLRVLCSKWLYLLLPEPKFIFSSQHLYPWADESILLPGGARLYFTVLTPLTLSELFSRNSCIYFPDRLWKSSFFSNGPNFLRVSEASYYLRNNPRKSNWGWRESISSGFPVVKCPNPISSHTKSRMT